AEVERDSIVTLLRGGLWRAVVVAQVTFHPQSEVAREFVNEADIARTAPPATLGNARVHRQSQVEPRLGIGEFEHLPGAAQKAFEAAAGRTARRPLLGANQAHGPRRLAERVLHETPAERRATQKSRVDSEGLVPFE